MPRIPRNPGSGKRPVNSPARSTPGDKAGRGWGGEAKGASTSPLYGSEPDERRMGQNNSMSRWNQARRDAAQANAMDLYETVMQSVAEPTPNRLAAADKLLDRLEGKPIARQDHTSQGQRLGYVIAAPPEAESAEAWIQQHKPR